MQLFVRIRFVWAFPNDVQALVISLNMNGEFRQHIPPKERKILNSFS